jgi:hypothetical protein
LPGRKSLMRSHCESLNTVLTIVFYLQTANNTTTFNYILK